MDKFHLFPPQASTTAQQVDWVFFAVAGVMLFFCIAVFVPISFFAVKYRRGSAADRSNPVSRSILLEAGWTLFPALIGLGLFGWGAVVYYHLERPPADALEVHVVGKQWMWKIQHAEGKREIDELHVPVGRTVTLVLTSQDVIHSFFIPAFRIKQDAVPGRYTREWFKATKPGEYHLFCAEFCGTDHSHMIGRVVAMAPLDYQRWLQTGSRTDSLAMSGERLFRERGCSGCHGANSSVRAPPLETLYRKPRPLSSGGMITADDRYLRDAIVVPAKEIAAGYENVMPSYAGQLSEEEIMQLIAYLKSLGEQEAPSK